MVIPAGRSRLIPMGPTIVYYTNGLLPKPLLHRTLAAASEAAAKADGSLVVSSHIPLFEWNVMDCSAEFSDLACARPDPRFLEFLATVRPFHKPSAKEVNLVTGHLNYSLLAIAKQIVHAASQSVALDPAVILFEHDVLYPENYIGDMREALGAAEFAVYYDCVFLDCDGFFKPGFQFWHLSRYAAKKLAIISHFGQKIHDRAFQTLEPILAMHRDGDPATANEIISNYEVCSGPPVLDIKHGTNASGQLLVDDHYSSFDYWGDLKDNGLLQLLDDPEYAKLMAGWPELGWGLFRS